LGDQSELRLPEKKNRSRVFLLLSIYVAISLMFILTNRTELSSDAKFYNEKAEECLRFKTFYPARHNEYDDYVQNPGYVNYLILLKGFGLSLKGIYALNILLNVALLLILYSIAKDIFGYPLHPLIYLFVIYPRNYATNVGLYSDLLSVVLAYLALLLFLKRRKVWVFLSGFVLAIANFVRPEAIIFILSLFIYSLLKKIAKARFVPFVASFLCGVLLIGLVTYQGSGHFIFQSVTGGINLLVGANPEADGAGNVFRSLFQKGKLGYLPDSSSVSYVDKDKYWMSQALNWIKHNPRKYIGLFFMKIYYSFYRDSWGINQLANTNFSSRQVRDLPLAERAIWYFFQFLNQAIYLGIIILALYSYRHLIYLKASLILYLIPISGIIFIGILYGESKIKYPLIPVFLIAASYSVDWLIMRWRKKSGEAPVGVNR
jgi:hypothetical protein